MSLSPARHIGSQLRNDQYTLTRPRAHPHAAAILLRAIEPVRKPIIRRHMIDLCRRLVIPGAPRSSRRPRSPRCPGRSTTPSGSGLADSPRSGDSHRRPEPLSPEQTSSRIRSHIRRRINHISLIRIRRINRDRFKVPAAPPKPRLRIDQPPRRSRIIREINPSTSLRLRAARRRSRPDGLATLVPISSTTAHSRFGLLGETAIPILPTNSSFGSPPASCFHVSPPSIDLYSPLPGIYEGAYTDHGGRRVAHSDAYSTRGFFGSIARSIAPTLFGSVA